MKRIDLDKVSAETARLIMDGAAKHGDAYHLMFPDRGEAVTYIDQHGLTNWQPYGLRNEILGHWFMIRVVDWVKPRERAAPAQRAATGAPTAKSLCLSVWEPGIERGAFVAAAVALGVKEVTAKTMYSDIKNGRIK